MPPTRETRSGQIRIAETSNFIVSTAVPATLVTMRPGALRELHWHPNADEWQYYISGKARMGGTGPNALAMDFKAGDIHFFPFVLIYGLLILLYMVEQIAACLTPLRRVPAEN